MNKPSLKQKLKGRFGHVEQVASVLVYGAANTTDQYPSK